MDKVMRQGSSARTQDIIRAGELDSKQHLFVSLMLDSIRDELISEITGAGWDTVITLMNSVKIVFIDPDWEEEAEG